MGAPDDNRIRLTSDIALLHDVKYFSYVKEYAENMDAFNKAFDEAWFDLTTTYGSGTWASNAKCDNGVFPESLRLVKSAYMMNTDVDLSAAKAIENQSNKLQWFLAGAISTSMIFAFALRLRKQS